MNDKNVAGMLYDEINKRMQEMSVLEVESSEYKAIASEVTKLIDRYNEMAKIEMASIESYERIEAQKEELKLKKKEHVKDIVDCVVKNGLTLASIVGGFALTVWGAKATFEFEQEGVVTSTVGRTFINSLFKKK